MPGTLSHSSGSPQSEDRRKRQRIDEDHLTRRRSDVDASRTDNPEPGSGGNPTPRLAQVVRDEAHDTDSPAYQRVTWDALRKNIHALVNKATTANLKDILPKLFGENLVRGRGLLCKSLIKSQMAAPSYTPVYAALAAVVNSKLPELGMLLAHRLIAQFRQAYQRNEKEKCLAAAWFIGHLVNQQVAHELLAPEVLTLLLETPSDFSVEVAVRFLKEVGAMLGEISLSGMSYVFDRLTGILNEGVLETRTIYLIQDIYATRKAGFERSGFPAISKELDLVESQGQICHEVELDMTLDTQPALDIFQVDPVFEQHEREYEAVKREILGLASDGNYDEAAGDGRAEGEEEVDEAEEGAAGAQRMNIQDVTEADRNNLRRVIYQTLHSDIEHEAVGHKLLSMELAPGGKLEVVSMIVACCMDEKTYNRLYGRVLQRLCLLKREFQYHAEARFRNQYAAAHRLETHKLRNLASLFAHLLATDAISWSALSCIRLTEADSTSSTRIFLKVLFEELSNNMTLPDLNARLQDPSCADWVAGIFPRDSPHDTRFSINFFASIDLAGLTDALREHLASAQQQVLAAADASSESYSSGSSDSDSGSDSGSGSDLSESGTSFDEYDSDSSGSDSSGSDSSASEQGVPPAQHKRRSSPPNPQPAKRFKPAGGTEAGQRRSRDLRQAERR